MDVIPAIIVTASLFNIQNNQPIGRTFESQPLKIKRNDEDSIDWDCDTPITLYFHTQIQNSNNIRMAIGLSIIEMGYGEVVMGSYNVGYASFPIFRKEPED